MKPASETPAWDSIVIARSNWLHRGCAISSEVVQLHRAYFDWSTTLITGPRKLSLFRVTSGHSRTLEAAKTAALRAARRMAKESL